MTAARSVLLSAMMDDDERPLDGGDLFGLLELAGHHIERPAALRAALAVGLV